MNDVTVLSRDTRILRVFKRKRIDTIPLMNKPLAGLAPVPTKTPVNKTGAEPVPVASKEALGWDPYEVWRTRVLLPQVVDQPAEARAVETNVKPFLARSA